MKNYYHRVFLKENYVNSLFFNHSAFMNVYLYKLSFKNQKLHDEKPGDTLSSKSIIMSKAIIYSYNDDSIYYMCYDHGRPGLCYADEKGEIKPVLKGIFK